MKSRWLREQHVWLQLTWNEEYVLGGVQRDDTNGASAAKFFKKNFVCFDDVSPSKTAIIKGKFYQWTSTWRRKLIGQVDFFSTIPKDKSESREITGVLMHFLSQLQSAALFPGGPLEAYARWAQKHSIMYNILSLQGAHCQCQDAFLNIKITKLTCQSW